MKSEKTETIQYTLVLNQAERDWLKGIVQNPLFVDNPADEDPQDIEMLRVFWDALADK